MNTEKYLFTIYAFYSKKTVLIIRILLITIPIGITFLYRLEFSQLKYIIALYGLLSIHEIFIHRKIYKEKPSKTVSAEGNDYTASMVFSARLLWEKYRSTHDFVTHLIRRSDVQFFLKKISQETDISYQEIDKSKITKRAYALVQEAHGKYISELDLFVAYLLLSENESKFLERSDVPYNDCLIILSWTRKFFEIDRAPQKISFSGSGLFDFFVYGWNYEVKKYVYDMSSKVLSKAIHPSLAGREDEYNAFLTYLSKSKVNNVLIVGPPGVGKTTLIEYFAYESHRGEVPSNLARLVVFELLVDRILADVHSQGELEARLGVLLEDMSHSENALILIQNIENIFGEGGFQFDISGILFEYLKGSKIQFIGTTTPVAYKTVFVKKESITELFEVITLEEPDSNRALFMLFDSALEIETRYSVQISYLAVKEAIELSSFYFPDQYLPGKAVNLLENIASEHHIKNTEYITQGDVITFVQKKTHVILEKPTNEEKEVLLNLEDTIHKKIINQEEAVKGIASAMRRLRSGFKNKNRPISTFLFLGPTGAGKTETAKALAEIYFGNVENMIRIDMSEYQTQDSITRFLGGNDRDDSSETLVDMVRKRPSSLILLDEFEKAHSHILDVFLQVFDDGRLTDNKGQIGSFSNTIIIATSNAGSELVRENIQSNTDQETLKKQLIEHLLRKDMLKPELMNRFDDVVVFVPLTVAHAKEVARLLLDSSLSKLEDQMIHLSYDNSIIEKIVHEAYSKEFGARNIRRYIENTIEAFLSGMILDNTLIKGRRALLTLDENERLMVR